jgi:lysophospholipase L1-like esterase
MKKCLLLVVVLALSLTMCLGDSITKGAGDPAPSLSGFRAQLFDDLNKAGIKYQFVGCTTVNSNQEMIASGQQYHNGYGSYRIDQIRKNLDGVQGVGGGDANVGGYWLTGGNGTNRDAVDPDIVIILAGTNDLGQNAQEPDLEKRMSDLLAWFKENRPQAQVFVGTVPPRGPNKPGFETYNPAVVTFNTWITSDVATRGGNFHLVDIYSIFVDASGQAKAPGSSDGIFLQDGIHPTHQGYVAMGDAWFAAISPLLTQNNELK